MYIYAYGLIVNILNTYSGWFHSQLMQAVATSKGTCKTWEGFLLYLTQIRKITLRANWIGLQVKEYNSHYAVYSYLMWWKDAKSSIFAKYSSSNVVPVTYTGKYLHWHTIIEAGKFPYSFHVLHYTSSAKHGMNIWKVAESTKLTFECCWCGSSCS